jgi:Ca-activated chloride channel family protein
VGNISPKEKIEIHIKYVERMGFENGAYRFPTVVGPLYIPGVPSGDRSGHGVVPPTDRVPDADNITPPLALGDPLGS